ncbi:MAG: hypothetical protein IPO62_04240 [Saprospiraceae bacterium]|nr:hypothetical protein [Saprospiraceae bacterium]
MENIEEMNELFAGLETKKHLTLDLLSKSFKLNLKRTKNLLAKTLQKEITANTHIRYADLIKDKTQFIENLAQERLEYIETLKEIELQKQAKAALKIKNAEKKFEENEIPD